MQEGFPPGHLFSAKAKEECGKSIQFEPIRIEFFSILNEGYISLKWQKVVGLGGKEKENKLCTLS